MKTIASLLSAATLFAVAPAASAAVERPAVVTVAEQRERGDFARLEHHARAARLARRDLAIAERAVEVTRLKWDAAVAHGHPNDAGYWAQRHAAAVAAERAADGRWLAERAERELARADLRSDSDRVRQLTVDSGNAP